ncbi:LipA and NB-ARC domain-containing protein [Colletotrichum limetticola]|uniref:LipA and NB-ARC domain-containing protein n=1 Tax=Colletotrichum limetticola TaxID=1209924 RepID=A0ABQ9P8G3_9PEZI|nr:LipA and NB-ARC domain-containing protein [Colletotrichum limetticola]
MNLLRGKTLRFQSKFQDSLECLSKSRCATELLRDLHFDEEAGDLIVEIADTMRAGRFGSRGRVVDSAASATMSQPGYPSPARPVPRGIPFCPTKIPGGRSALSRYRVAAFVEDGKITSMHHHS